MDFQTRSPRSRHGRAILFALVLLLCLAAAAAVRPQETGPKALAGNARLESFAQARRLLHQIYADHRQTLYCRATFHEDRSVTPPPGFHAATHRSRATRLEWEHVVPAAQFGGALPAWRDGDERCVRRDGTPFRGRRCAEKVSREFRRMQADLHNIFPAIGAVNAARSHHDLTTLPDETSAFGACRVKLARQAMEPPDAAKGTVARASLYMAAAYPHVRLSPDQEALFRAWDAAFPPDVWECERERRIRRVQGNGNPFVRRYCE